MICRRPDVPAHAQMVEFRPALRREPARPTRGVTQPPPSRTNELSPSPPASSSTCLRPTFRWPSRGWNWRTVVGLDPVPAAVAGAVGGQLDLEGVAHGASGVDGQVEGRRAAVVGQVQPGGGESSARRGGRSVRGAALPVAGRRRRVRGGHCGLHRMTGGSLITSWRRSVPRRNGGSRPPACAAVAPVGGVRRARAR